MIRPFAVLSPRQKARTAGGLFLLLVLVSACTEFFARGRSSFAAHLAAGIVEVSCMAVVTLLLYDIFRPVQKYVSLAAFCANLAAVALELLRIQPYGVHIGLGLHAVYWVLVGWLIFRSSFLPHILGALAGTAGICWLIFLGARSASPLSRYSLAGALIVEGSVMLWLFAMGLNASQWNAQVEAVRVSPHS